MLGVLVLAGAILRLLTLDDQSFWRDEASTVLDLHGSLGDLWTRIIDSEGMPPLYFMLAWPWSKVFGDGEVALRALSAVFGIATIPVAWALARRLAPEGHRRAAGTLAAGLVAFNPFLVWYAQEARAYALLSLLTALAMLLFVCALDELRPRTMALWGLAAAASLATHWFAAFLVVPQAVTLMWVLRRRALRGIVVLTAAGAALLPLLLAQRDTRVGWVSDSASLATRTVDVAKHWSAGPFGTAADLLGALAVVVLAAGALAAFCGAGRSVRIVAMVLAAALILPMIVALAGADYVLDRYLIGALIPLCALAAVGFARSPRPVLAVGAGLAVLWLGFTVDNARDEQRHREDWRAVSRLLRDGLPPQAVLVTADGEPPLDVYLADIHPLTAPENVRDIAIAASWRFGRPRPPTPPAPAGFHLVGRWQLPTATVVRYSATMPQDIDPAAIAGLTLDPSQPAATLLRPRDP